MSRLIAYLATGVLLLLVASSGTQLAGQDADRDKQTKRSSFKERMRAARFGLRDSQGKGDHDRFADEDEFNDGLEDSGRFSDEDEFDDEDELSDDLDDGDFEDGDFDEDGFGNDEDFEDDGDFDEEDGRFDDEDGFEDEDRGDDEFEDRRRRGRGRRGDDEDEFDVEMDDFDLEDEITEEQMEVAGWIGAEVGPLDPAVAAHVSLEDGQGLMVYGVLPESPAANAGLQEFDILISVAGTALTDFAQLRDHVSQAKGSEVSVDILRKGKKQTVPLKPGEQPWIPDVFMPGNVDLPDNVEVTISKKGGGPVTVTIRQGDQTWTASSEEEFEELPEQSVMWLFATMSEFMPFEEEEEFAEGWEGEGVYEYERFSARGIPMEEDEEFGEDPYERRLNDLEGKIDRILKQLEAK